MITHRASESVYCTTKCRGFESFDYDEQWAGTTNSKIFESAHDFRIESERPIQIESNLKALQVPINSGDCALRLHQRWSLHALCVPPLATEPSRRLLHLFGTVCRSQYGHRRHCKFLAAD